MKPKEKAEELFNKMFQSVFATSYNSYEMAKQCALIAVDEILNMPKIASFRRDEVYMELEYWIEVKNEIEKL